MTRKRTPTKEENGRSHQCKEKTSRLSDKALPHKDRPNPRPGSSSRAQGAILTLATILTTIVTSVVLYSIYPQLTSFASSARKPAPSLRQIVNSEEHSYFSKRDTDTVLIPSVFQPAQYTHSDVSEILSKTASLFEAEDKEVAKLAAQIMKIKTRTIEESGKIKSSEIGVSSNIAPPEPELNTLQSEISNGLKSQEKILEGPKDRKDQEQVLLASYMASSNDDDNEQHYNGNNPHGVKPLGKNSDNAKVVKTLQSSLSEDKVIENLPVPDGGNTKPIVLSAENPHITVDFKDTRHEPNPQKEKIHIKSYNKNSQKTDRAEETRSSSSMKSDRTPKKEKISIPRQSTNQKKENSKRMVNSNTKKKNSLKQPKVSSEKNSVAQAETKSRDTAYKPLFQKTFVPKKTFYGGRRIAPIELLKQKPSNSSVKVFLFDDFLSQQECEGLISAHNSHVEAFTKPPILCFDSLYTLQKHIRDAGQKIEVTSQIFTEGTSCVNSSFSLQLQNWLNSNWSYSTAFYPGESKFSTNVAARLQQAMGLKPESGGKFQITSYPLGKAYKTHTDCTPGSLDKRDRVVSVLMYLNDAEEGGETKFPDLGIWVKPKRGRAIVWNNMSPEGECELNSRHVASLVKKGKKYILIRWYYYKSFPGLGQRPSSPELPLRHHDQAKVSCDDYDNGSCRWYDEWTYEHLTEYQQSELNLS